MPSHPLLRYTTARLGLFLAVAAVLYLLGARGVLLVGLALLVSGLLSFRLLSRQRDAVSGALVGRSRRLQQRLDENAGAEDDD